MSKRNDLRATAFFEGHGSKEELLCCRSTATTTDTCPKLDYLLIGGPDLNALHTLDKQYFQLIREHVLQFKAFFTTSTTVPSYATASA
jgi:hypothetical protein